MSTMNIDQLLAYTRAVLKDDIAVLILIVHVYFRRTPEKTLRSQAMGVTALTI